MAPAYDLNPVPSDIKARILSTNIDLDEATCSIDLLEDSAEYYGLSLKQARSIIKEVSQVTRDWRHVARKVGARDAEIKRMETAFEHAELQQALRL